MSDEAGVEVDTDPRFRIECYLCGWTSPWRSTEQACREDHERHRAYPVHLEATEQRYPKSEQEAE